MDYIVIIEEELEKEFKATMKKEYGIDLVCDLKSSKKQIIEELDFIMSYMPSKLIKNIEGEVGVNTVDYESITIYYSQFFFYTNDFSEETPERREFLKNIFLEVATLPPDNIWSSDEFYQELLNFNVQLALRFEMLKFEMFKCAFENFYDGKSNKEKMVIHSLADVFNCDISTSNNEYIQNIEYLIDCINNNVEYTEYLDTKDSLNFRSVYKELWREVGEISFTDIDLEQCPFYFENKEVMRVLDDLFDKENRLNMLKGRDSLVRGYLGSDQLVLNEELLVNGCACTVNEAEHSIIIYNEYLKENIKRLR